MRVRIIGIGIGIATIISVIFLYQNFFAAPQKSDTEKVFTVGRGVGYDEVVDKLFSNGFVLQKNVARALLRFRGVRGIPEGGYMISKSMSAWKVAGVLMRGPSLKWFTIQEGLRKEEIADIFTPELRWSKKDIEEFMQAAAEEKMIAAEGVYFPDTYLVPLEESGKEVARRMFTRFNEKFAEYHKLFLQENIKSDTALKIASLVQREAAGKDDMPLIAGIIWNRLLIDMKLDIDATVQYARGNTGAGWWAPIKAEDKKIDSPYNTYREKGLPPTPIANPGIETIEAVLYPANTECLYYVHDIKGVIHCAKTYEQHQKNIELFLKILP